MTSSTRDNLLASQQKATYTLDQPEFTMAKKANTNTRRHRREQRKYSEDSDPTDQDCSGSLSYSAASSINSAGESTDSSFADIMKVLDVQDPTMAKENGLTPSEYTMYHRHQANVMAPQRPPYKQRSGQASVASSLQYSTDGESHVLYGADLVSTITGQPSDSTAHDGGSTSKSAEEFDNQDILFAPAEPTDSLKKRKKEKKNRSKHASTGTRSRQSYNRKGSGPSVSTSTSNNSSRSSPRHKNSTTPPPVPRSKSMNTTVEDDICYAEWWMSCFPDAFKEMMPRR